MCIFAQTNVNDMKKIMYVIAAAVVLLATGCKKEKFIGTAYFFVIIGYF